jgi:hypothetical protein
MANFKDLTLPNKIALSFLGICFGYVLIGIIYGSIFGVTTPYDKIAIAKVGYVQPSHNPKNWTTYVHYTFSVAGKTYEGDYNSQVLFQKLDTLNGKYFPLMYWNKYPDIGSHLLITPYSFHQYNLPYPDSLKWVCEFVWCQ